MTTPTADDYRDAAREHWRRTRSIFIHAVADTMAGLPTLSGPLGCAQESARLGRLYDKRARWMDAVDQLNSMRAERLQGIAQ